MSLTTADLAKIKDLITEAVSGSEKRITQRLDSMEGRFTGVEGRLTGVEGRLGKVEAGLQEVRGDIADLKESLVGIIDDRFPLLGQAPRAGGARTATEIAAKGR